MGHSINQFCFGGSTPLHVSGLGVNDGRIACQQTAASAYTGTALDLSEVHFAAQVPMLAVQC